MITSPFIIAPLRPSGYEMAKVITERCWPGNPQIIARLDEELRLGNNWCAITPGGRIVGFAGWMRSPCCSSIAEFTWMNIEPEFQNRKIGRLLGKACTDDMRAAGYSQVIFTTHIPDMYTSIGYHVITTVKGIAKEPSYLMIGDLSEAGSK